MDNLVGFVDKFAELGCKHEDANCAEKMELIKKVDRKQNIVFI